MTLLGKSQSLFSDAKRIRRIAGFSATGEPQKSYMFEVGILDTSSTNFKSLESVKDLLKSSDPEQRVRFFAKSINIPSKSRDPISFARMGQTYYFAGKNTSAKTLNLVMWDDIELTVMKYMHRWMDLTGNGLGQATPIYIYRQDMVIDLKDGTDLLTTARIILRDCFPTEIGDVPLSYDEGGIIEHQITIKFSSMEILFAENITVVESALSAGVSVALRTDLISSTLKAVKRLNPLSRLNFPGF